MAACLLSTYVDGLLRKREREREKRQPRTKERSKFQQHRNLMHTYTHTYVPICIPFLFSARPSKLCNEINGRGTPFFVATIVALEKRSPLQITHLHRDVHRCYPLLSKQSR